VKRIGVCRIRGCIRRASPLEAWSRSYEACAHIGVTMAEPARADEGSRQLRASQTAPQRALSFRARRLRGAAADSGKRARACPAMAALEPGRHRILGQIPTQGSVRSRPGHTQFAVIISSTHVEGEAPAARSEAVSVGGPALPVPRLRRLLRLRSRHQQRLRIKSVRPARTTIAAQLAPTHSGAVERSSGRRSKPAASDAGIPPDTRSQ